MIDLATTPRLNVRVDEFCAMFNVSRRTVYNWFKAGLITSVCIGHGRRIPIQEVRDLAAGRKQLPVTPRKPRNPVQSQAPAP